MDKSTTPFVALEISKDNNVEENSSHEKREKYVSNVVVVMSLLITFACIFSVVVKVYDSYVISQYAQQYIEGLETSNAACLKQEQSLKNKLYILQESYDYYYENDDENKEEYKPPVEPPIQDKLWEMCQDIARGEELDNPQDMTSTAREDNVWFCTTVFDVMFED